MTPPRVLLIVALLLVSTGCLRQVPVKSRGLVQMKPEHLPTTRRADGSVVGYARPELTGKTQTLRYDGLLWRFTRMPYVHATRPSKRLVLIDTGMDWFARVTLDVASEQRLPVNTAEKPWIAYVKRLSLGAIELRALPAVTWDRTYEVRVGFVPIYRLRVWVLGNMLLRQAKYLAFDNPRRRITIGREPFAPDDGLRWTSYPMHERDDRPEVDIPLAGQTVRVLADTAGGPNLTLNAPEWERIKPHVRVKGHKTDTYPSWDAFVPVDVYTVDRLTIGPVTRRNAVVWVHRNPESDVSPVLGLGPLEDCVVVFDYAGRKLWIGRKK